MWKIQFYFYQINGALSKYHSTLSVIKVLINNKKKIKKSFIIFFEKSSFLYQMDGTSSNYQAIGHVINAFINQKSQNFKQKKNLS